MINARACLRALLLGLVLVPCVTLASSAILSGCGSDIVGETQPYDSGPFGVETLFPEQPPLPGESECKVVITKGITVPGAAHVPVCTRVDYETNPPSGGNHWGVWAAFKAYASPVPRESYVHDMEHGAVVLLYRCDSSAACPEVVKELEDVRAGVTSDSLCVASPGGVNARIVLTPDPMLDTPVAAAAWGATYTATCLDKASLANFIADVYGKGPEATCASGKDYDDPASGAPDCDAGAGG
jgi:hypothetical protein